MSSDNLTGEELLNFLEAEWKASTPPECYNGFKRFTKCKKETDEEIIKTKGKVYFKETSTLPFARFKGCRNEFNSYQKCISDFMHRYTDMKNFVNDIERKKHFKNI
jgi:hypothetical protein